MADKETTPSRAGGTRQAPPRRSDVIRCENCGEEYSVTYKRCPFCDERPGRPSRPGGRSSGGRRVANNKRGGGYGGPVNPIHVIWLVISLVVIIAACGILAAVGGGDEPDEEPAPQEKTDTCQTCFLLCLIVPFLFHKQVRHQIGKVQGQQTQREG